MTSLSTQYAQMMSLARRRFERLAVLEAQGTMGMFPLEEAALHVRKIIELIAFGCMVAAEHSLSEIPRDARTQWSAATILDRLDRRGITVFPSPSILRPATAEESAAHSVKATIQGLPERRMTVKQLLAAYERTNRWLHELNPYSHSDPNSLIRDGHLVLWADVHLLKDFLRQHFISIGGRAFYCDLWESSDGRVRAQSFDKDRDA